MMFDLSGRLFNVPPMTLDEHVKRRTVRKLPTWRSAPVNPPALPRDLTTPVGTPLGMRAPRPGTSHVRSDRAFSVSDYVWVSMETGRVDRLKFGSVVALPDDALLRGTRCLMSLPGGDFVVVLRISSSDLATLVDRAVDGMLSSLTDVPNTREDTFPVSRDENGDKSNLRDGLCIRPPADEETLGNRKPPDDLRTLWNMMPMATDTKLGGILLARQLLRSTKTGPLMMIGLPCCTWSNVSKNTAVTTWTGWQVGRDKKRSTNMSEPRLKWDVSSLAFTWAEHTTNSIHLVPRPWRLLLDELLRLSKPILWGRQATLGHCRTLRRTHACHGLHRPKLASCCCKENPRNWTWKISR